MDPEISFLSAYDGMKSDEVHAFWKGVTRGDPGTQRHCIPRPASIRSFTYRKENRPLAQRLRREKPAANRATQRTQANLSREKEGHAHRHPPTSPERQQPAHKHRKHGKRKHVPRYRNLSRASTTGAVTTNPGSSETLPVTDSDIPVIVSGSERRRRHVSRYGSLARLKGVGEDDEMYKRISVHCRGRYS